MAIFRYESDRDRHTNTPPLDRQSTGGIKDEDVAALFAGRAYRRAGDGYCCAFGDMTVRRDLEVLADCGYHVRSETEYDHGPRLYFGLWTLRHRPADERMAAS